jgi:F420-non-reducing hydrogenase iron-sulfur subunit
LLKALLKDFGVEEDRVRQTWVSASEGQRFADVVTDLTERVKALGPSHIRPSLLNDQRER